MAKSAILDLPLSDFMRSEIALPLQHVLHLYTVGSLLRAWRSPRNQKSIEQIFDTPEQAHHAVAVCAAWLGIQPIASTSVPTQWWSEPARAAMQA